MSDTLASALKQIRTPEEGERMLYAAVIYTAKQDATGGEKGESAALREVHRRSALTYFQGPVYRHQCEMLGVAPILPPEVERELGHDVAEVFQVDDPQEEIAVMTRSMDEIFTREKCLSLHKQYLEKDLALGDLYVEGRKGRSVSSATIAKYFKAFGLPTRPQGGWTPKAHAAALAVHGLTAHDVESPVTEYTRPCAVCGKEIKRYKPFSGSPEYTHCGGTGCVAEVRSRRKRDREIGDGVDVSATVDKNETVDELTDEIVVEMHKRYLAGESIKKLAVGRGFSWQKLEGAMRRAGLPKRNDRPEHKDAPLCLTADTSIPFLSISKRNGVTTVGSMAETKEPETGVPHSIPILSINTRNSPLTKLGEPETAVSFIPSLPEQEETPLEETAVSHTNGIDGLAKIDSLRDLVTQLESHGAKVQVSGKLTVELEF